MSDAPPSRPTSLKSRLTRTLVGLGLVSVVLLAAVNFVVVRDLLDRTSRGQLETIRELRSDSVELGFERFLDRVAVLGTDPGLSVALSDLDAGYRTLDDELSAEQTDELIDASADVIQVLDDAGVDSPTPAELLPESDQGRNAQYLYVATNPNPAGERAELLDAGDGSEYSAAHARHHEYLRDLQADLAASDVLLISTQSGEVIYSVEKRIDLGTNSLRGPYADSGLGRVVQRLSRSGVSDAVVVDSAFYLPDLSVPLLHFAAAVRQDTEVVGVIVVELSIDGLTALVTESGQWDLLGLGDTGDAYIVGADGTLRTIPRSWSDDPEAYVERFLKIGGEERTAGLMTFTESPVLLHEIDNEAVSEALVGDEFVGTVPNGLDRRALTASAPLDLPGLSWAIVTEQLTSETRDELERFLWSTLVLLAILLPILAIVGIVLARVFARPVGPLVDAASEIAGGNFDAEVEDLGRNELGDLGRQLNGMAAQLRDHEASIAAEEDRITRMLASVLPPDLVERVRAGERDVTELVDSATVIAVNVGGLPEPSGAEHETLIDLTERLGEVGDAVRIEYGIERIRAASDEQIFVAGRGRTGHEEAASVAFARAMIDQIAEVGTEFGVHLEARAGLAAGFVASGVLGSRQVSYGMWGEAVVRATELADGMSGQGVFVDVTVADALDPDSVLTPVTEGAVSGDAYRIGGPTADAGASSDSEA